jgi:hypothetical protein
MAEQDATAALAATSPTPSTEDIAELAQHLYEEAGSPSGRDQEFWLQAEEQLRKHYETSPHHEGYAAEH